MNVVYSFPFWPSSNSFLRFLVSYVQYLDSLVQYLVSLPCHLVSFYFSVMLLCYHSTDMLVSIRIVFRTVVDVKRVGKSVSLFSSFIHFFRLLSLWLSVGYSVTVSSFFYVEE